MLTDAQLRHFDQFVSAMHHLTVDFPTPCRYCSVHAVTEGAEAQFALFGLGLNRSLKEANCSTTDVCSSAGIALTVENCQPDWKS